jgi:phosphomannomutase
MDMERGNLGGKCGATFDIAPAVLKATGCRVTALNAHPDGFFPARSSEPTAESLKDLAQVVKALDAEVGVAFDGDGDRVAFIDDAGRFVDFDRALAAFSAFAVKKNGGGIVVTNVEASMCVEKMVEARGGKVVRTRVGDVYVSEAMKSCGGIGGEPCDMVHPVPLLPGPTTFPVLFGAWKKQAVRSSWWKCPSL